jgi:hypothetical protein
VLAPAEVVASLRRRRFRFQSEAELQAGMSVALTEDSIAHEREVVIAEGDRIDFLCADGVGVEVKVGGSLADVTRQLHRYAQNPRVTSLVLASSRARLLFGLPSSLNGKPLHLVAVGGMF